MTLFPRQVADLISADNAVWRQLRESQARRLAVRALGRGFRRDPIAHLGALDQASIRNTPPASFFLRCRGLPRTCPGRLQNHGAP
jgi:hypothetical protein